MYFRLVGGGDTNVNILENGQTLYIKNSRLTDSGQYKCVATNSAGFQTKESKLVVNGKLNVMLNGYDYSIYLSHTVYIGICHTQLIWNYPSLQGLLFIVDGSLYSKYFELQSATTTDVNGSY